MGMLDDLRHLLLLKRVRDRLKEAEKMKHLKVVIFGLVGAIATGVMASLTGACPGLLASLPAIATAGIGSVFTYYVRKPLTAPVAKASVTGLGAFAVASMLEQLKLACSADFVTQIPTLAMAGVWVGLGMWLKAPHETPTLGSVSLNNPTLKK